ncbi:ATPase synthesis protein 25 mitochondrial [Onygenales sp. PD_40]|nr:ATPase synthesis protein 25 mitochondrial [Onygenales sp. PD_40]KAK2803101.1 ATPase synthesis protein 25 mitochondrial [Onygenales sp. PD_10]
MSRAVLKGIQCHACCHTIVRSFVALSGVAVTPSAASLSPRFHRPPPSRTFPPQHVRVFSSQPPQGPEPVDEAVPENASAQENSNPPDQPEEHVPWYLQEEVHETVSHPVRRQQELPPLPPNPPPILGVLLEHISVDIGLDNLSLLDLRSLDPPPALGANLIMIVGTARSTKHLNVSADRLCRWLRTTYRLRPDADGLLGRNELKIKLRRKARRAKLAKSAGSTLTQTDDGIITGWICVNVGTVDGGQPRQPDEFRRTGFIGFGTPVEGTRIVVQMVTEEKREELDLEGLWQRTLERNSIRDGTHSQTQSPEEGSQQVGATRESATGASADLGDRVSHRHQNQMNHEQRRGICTSLRRMQEPQSKRVDSRSLQQVEEDEPVAGTDACPTTKISIAEFNSSIRNLNYIPEDKARAKLGQGMHDMTSTPWVRWFRALYLQSNPELRSTQKLERMCAAILLHHPGYNKIVLWEAFWRHLRSNYPLSRPLGLRILDAMLSFKPVLNPDCPRVRLPDSEMELALRVVDQLCLRNISTFTPQILAKLLVGASFQSHVYFAKLDDNSPGPENAIRITKDEYDAVLVVQTRLAKLFDVCRSRPGPTEVDSLLRVYYYQRSFDQFWEIWKKMPFFGIARAKNDYQLLFQLHAESAKQDAVTKCLSTWVPMMFRERPFIKIDDELVRTIMRCILIVEPDVQRKSVEFKQGQFVALWKWCQKRLDKKEAEAWYTQLEV